MTIASDTDRSGPYNGNGVTTTFNYEFRITNEAHVRVVRGNADGTETTFDLGADYTVTGVGEAGGGQIVCTVAPATGTTLTVVREVPFTQETDLENQGAYLAQVVEDAFDLAVMRDQQLAEELARAVKLPVSSGMSGNDLGPEFVENIDTVAGIVSSIPVVAGIADDVETVAGIAPDVALLADLSAVLSGTASAARIDEKMFTGDGVTTAFTLDRAPGVDENVLVWVGGAIQDTADYSVAGTTLTFTAAPSAVEIRTLVITTVTANDIEQLRNQAVAAAETAELIANSIGVRVAADRTALKALDTGIHKVAFVRGSSGGLFRWHDGNYSTQVALDAAGGMYVKADAVVASAGAWLHVGEPVLAWWGAAADGVTNDNASIDLMSAVLGYIVFGRGDHLLTTRTISVPLFFETGAAITAAAGQVITVSNRVIAPKQQIFKGAGTFYSDISNQIGEDSKVVLAAWFGVFPVGATASSEVLTARVNKALQWYAFENREGVFELDNGSYYIDGKITVPRGVHLKGQGSRRTIFDLKDQGYTAIEAGGDAVKITGIQFEQHAGQESQRTGTLIDFLAYNGCVADDILGWGTDIGIKSAGNDARITRVSGRYNYGSNPGANSALVWIAGGSRVLVDDIWISGQTYSPDYVVLIGNGNASSITIVDVNNVQTTERSIPVGIIADNGAISLISIDGVICSGEATAACVKIKTTGSAQASAILIGGLIGNSQVTALVQIDQDSSGFVRYVTIESGVIYGSTGSGVILNRTAGTLSEITIGAAVNAIIRDTPLVKSGTMSNIFGFDGYGSVKFHEATAAQLASITAEINTKGKYAGKPVFDTTNIRLMVAAGSSAGATWRVCDNSATVIPV
ncbi:hypothetical protein [Sinorhizobium meliloti]|uniref:hypothetical protein n=1 Tax=Rhizobium meliloti TaxID=382 RepID=UPI000FD4EFB4|nr:hypothetical protein [Sinorhizobium meliloti]RVJ79204.1 hypothetical protein CN171_03945 [Sinorhizobium meliloti]